MSTTFIIQIKQFHNIIFKRFHLLGLFMLSKNILTKQQRRINTDKDDKLNLTTILKCMINKNPNYVSITSYKFSHKIICRLIHIFFIFTLPYMKFNLLNV